MIHLNKLNQYLEPLLTRITRHNIINFRTYMFCNTKNNIKSKSSMKKNTEVKRVPKYLNDKTSRLDQEYLKNVIPFDEFTRTLSRSRIDLAGADDINGSSNEKTNIITENLPWDFHQRIKPELEKNLKSVLAIERLITYEHAESLFLQYARLLEDQNPEDVMDFLEPIFASKLRKCFKELKENNIGFDISKDKAISNVKIDLFNISNIFTVGVHTNRKKNARDISKYFIYDSKISDIPIINIIKKKKGPEEKAIIKVQIDIIVDSSLHMSLKDKTKNSTINPLIEKPNSLHHMKLENDVLEANYKELKFYLKDNISLSQDQLTSFKFIFNIENWKIIDFDKYMNSNNLIPHE